MAAGQITTTSNIKNPFLTLTSNSLEEYATNATAEVAVSYTGYNGGPTQFRDFKVYDGKTAVALTITGSTKAATFAGAVSANGTVQVTATTTPASGSGLEIQGGANPTLFAYNRTGSAYLPLIITGSTLSMKMNNVDAFTLTGASAAASTATFAGAVTVAGTVIHTLSATPASASATGTVGTMSWDANYIYICTATNTWKRVAIATW
jgi:hypothetical protein